MKEKNSPLRENPLRKVESLYEELVAHYENAEDRHVRAAAKLLLVALDRFRQYGGPHWISLVEEYVSLIKDNPEKFDRIVKCQRGPGKSGC